MDGATRETFNLCLEFSIPMVTLMSERSGNPSVLADDFDGMVQATRHLVALGHRNIGYMVDQVAEQSMIPRRMAGYRHALSEAGLEPRPDLIAPLFNTGAFLERGRFSMRAWLDAGWKASGCTAILVQNDRAAIGAMQTLREAGIRVPEDVSVIGFDGTEECELCTPRLSTVAVPLREIGRKAVEFLLQQMDGCAAHQKTITLPVSLDLRESTAPVRQGGLRKRR
jgi:DNA-binding LacI/PurR family transcriptional regulator